ncbi:Na+:H+ antiporter, NhaA family [Actinopolyspora lacussalsi subsp. righensis]|uniref:Na(+)/H(+) antiporter NhaA n=1 Tax=Actinopolyspora righensis TaxID=995060 RepID=A0A1I7AJS9_9ACTN|nr:Na+/H+ antiporter NhaA [Actinopolyspora righensis]SFT75114.1 Na+:H+ antiporter, NhaA family [Actinopolyspora righensis]
MATDPQRDEARADSQGGNSQDGSSPQEHSRPQDSRPEEPQRNPVRRLFAPTPDAEKRTLADILRTETVGGVLVLVAAVLALLWANSPWGETYKTAAEFVPWPGGEFLGLDLNLKHWASDGLLAIFFFVVGLELKREFVVGELRNPRRAVLPVVAAVAGMIVPALFFFAIASTAGGDALRGWAIPTATDIAFALAVLAIVGKYLPSALRAFLLTLAVVDDLLAITVIAVFYTDDFHPLPLLGAVLPIVAFALLVRLRGPWWPVLLVLGVLAWGLVHESGVHATIAGVLLGFMVPVLGRGGSEPGPAEHLEHRWRPISAGVAVPLFALFAAGVSLGGGGIATAFADPVVPAVMAGLVLGKLVGIFGATFLMAKFTGAQLDANLSWWDLIGLSLLAGIGFTVSLLIGELAFGAGERGENVKVAVLLGSVLAALLASVVLGIRNRAHRGAQPNGAG